MAAQNGSPAPNEGSKLTAEIKMYVDPELKRVAGEAAEKAGLPLSEWIAKVIARKLGKPSLGKIPRKAFGRPRKPIAS